LLGRCPRLLSAARKRGPKDRLRSPRRAASYLTRTCVPPFEYVRPINSMSLRKFRPGFFLRKRSAIRRNKTGGPDAALVLLAQSNTAPAAIPGHGWERARSCLPSRRTEKVEKGSPEAAVPQPLISPAAGDGPPYVAPQAISIPARQKGQSACCFFGLVARSYRTSSITASWPAITTTSPGWWFRSARASGDT
jgi:hypothetical protein